MPIPQAGLEGYIGEIQRFCDFFEFFYQFSEAHAQPERRVVEKCLMAQNAYSNARTAFWGVSLNEIFARI
jgi:hypothetical protein